MARNDCWCFVDWLLTDTRTENHKRRDRRRAIIGDTIWGSSVVAILVLAGIGAFVAIRWLIFTH